MESGLVASVTAGNSLSGATTIRLYGTLANAVCADGPVEVTFFVRESPPHAGRSPFLRPLPTKRRAQGEVSSVGQLVGEPRVETWEEDTSDGLNTCERCVREMVAALDGEAPFPCATTDAASSPWRWV